jgi:uncharacterized membrane protein YphA (DoxX/SURF4 family)
MIQVNKTALICLRWTVGVVLLVEAGLLAFSRSEIHFAGHAGVDHRIRLALAWSEILACILFLAPRSGKTGAMLLLMVFALAALVHVLHGNFQIGGLLIYAAAVWVVLSQSQRLRGENQHA